MQHRLLDGGAATFTAQVWASAAEQLEQHHAQRVDVRSGADRAAQQLLGRGVVGRQQRLADLGQGRVRLRRIVQRQGDAEVQQLHLAGRIDVDVRRLQIAVHD